MPETVNTQLILSFPLLHMCLAIKPQKAVGPFITNGCQRPMHGWGQQHLWELLRLVAAYRPLKQLAWLG